LALNTRYRATEMTAMMRTAVATGAGTLAEQGEVAASAARAARPGRLEHVQKVLIRIM
jgi:hypothetical protein